MKTIKNIFFILLGVSMTFVACTKKEFTMETAPQPVYGTDFAVSINGQAVTFAYSGTAKTIQWYYGKTAEEALASIPVSGEEVKVIINLRGEYYLYCAASINGDYTFSEPQKFEVTTSDLSFLQTGIWKALSNGSGGYNVTYKLDYPANSGAPKAFWHNPVDFWGDNVAGALTAAAWGPWGGTDLWGWGATPEVGTISFDCERMTYKLILTDGVVPGSKTTSAGTIQDLSGTFEGTFSLVVHTRKSTDMVRGGDGVSVAKWPLIFNGNYSSRVDLDANTEWATISFDDNGRFPMDKGRVGEGQFLNSSLRSVEILYGDENGLVMNVKRSFEGFDASGRVANSCWLVYNYIIEGKDYSGNVLTEPIATGFSQSDLVGEWKYAEAAFDWIGWALKNPLNAWTTSAEIIATGWASLTTGYEDVRFTFNSDGSCDIDGVATTYTVSNGVITFADPVTFNPGTVNFMDITEIHATELSVATTGIWLGLQNGGNNESKAVHLIPAL